MLDHVYKPVDMHRPRCSRALRGRTRTRFTAFRPLIALTDLAIIALCVWGGVAARTDLFFLDPPLALESVVWEALWVICFGWLIAIWAFGGYARRFLVAGSDEYRRVLHASFVFACLLGAVCYLLEIYLSRTFFALLFIMGIPALLAGRILLRMVLRKIQRSGVMVRHALVVGPMVQSREIIETLRRESWLGYCVAGQYTPITAGSRRTEEDSLRSVIVRSGVDTVIFTSSSTESAAGFRQLAWELEHEDIEIIVVPAVTDIAADRVQMRPVAGLPLVHLEAPRARGAMEWGKRAFDVVGTIGILILLSPVMLVAALAVKLNDGGPVFFTQTRIGLNGEPFKFFKFRSMVTDAEARKAALAQQADRSNGMMFKMTRDPRITAPGRILRRYSIDELPQLFNVLLGDMSLVGPRPALREEVDNYSDVARRRLSVRPGLTGLWQVSGRSDLPWEETVRLDTYYVDNWSFVQDLTILFRTVQAVFSSRGAY